MKNRNDSIQVLHVDDEPDLADLVATFLEREDSDFEVQTASNGDEGLELVSAHDFDCIVSDYDMPGKNGIAFLREIREEHPDIPFILFTGKGSEEVASEAISAGVSDYLQKESGTDQYTILANRIRNYVERARAEREHEEIRERMELALEKTNSLVFEIDAKTGIVKRHGHFDHYFDMSPDTVPTWEDHLEHVVHPDDSEEFRQFYKQLIDGERGDGALEYRTAPEAGEVRWMRDTVHVNEPSSRHILGIAQDITAQKRQQQKREQVIERVTDAIVEVDSEWRFTLVNEQAETLYEMQESDLLGENFWDVFAEAEGTRFEEEYRRVMETREPTSFVEYFSQLDGWFDIEAYPKADGGLAFYFVEVTEQRERQQELEQANCLLSTLFETLPLGVLVEDADRNVLAVNDRMFDLFELRGSADEVVGTDCEQLAEQVSEMFVDSTRFIERINKLVTANEPVDDEEVVLQDGRTFERAYRPLELPDGEGHLWVYHDITEQKAERRRYEAVFNHTYQFTGLLEPDGTVIEANDTVLEFSNVDREEVIGKKVWEANLLQHSPETREQVKTAVEQAAGGAFIRDELRVQGADREAIVDFSVRPVTDEHGNVILLVPEGRDITERKEREEALQRERDRLDEFAGVVSHDLRNPLNVAQGRLALAQEECENEHLTAVETAIDRIDRITEDVLWLAREGRDIGSMDAVMLQETIEAAWNIVADQESNAELHYTEADLASVTIEADENRLSQLLENLFSNAIEHGGTGVTVTVGTLDDGFVVEDDGPGIPEERHDDIFTAGYSTVETGTGFGLSIVNQVAEAHGWDIRVTEGATGGARFEITGVRLVSE